ncbi:hypothetical protein ASF92_11845 [Pedobacter sp. Leaf176]|nr:hypothetical protein ASF92_11845 [Pedobacter sp. Leaf176]
MIITLKYLLSWFLNFLITRDANVSKLLKIRNCSSKKSSQNFQTGFFYAENLNWIFFLKKRNNYAIELLTNI